MTESSTSSGPNLFLLGAPRCGTTSLYDQLSRHPDVFCPSVKEPGYFTREDVRPDVFAASPHLQSFDNYLGLFSHRGDCVKVRVDGSTSYLRSRSALDEIESRFPDLRAIAIVRDPVELVSSYFWFLKFRGWEDQPTLERAWELQASRRAGTRLPPGARRPSSTIYADVARLGRQIEAARSILGDRLLVLTFDDLAADPGKTVEDVQVHAGLEPTDLGEPPRSNQTRVSRMQVIDDLVRSPPAPIAALRDRLKKRSGVSSLGVRRRLDAINSRPSERSISPELVSELRAHFRADIELLSATLGRDLSSEWGWD